MAGLLIPNAKQQFADAAGVPLAGGSVTHYIAPATTTPKNTWSDPSLTILNPNPIVLDAAGENPAGGVWGETGGEWRQVVRDRLGNLVWDKLTSTAASATSGSVYDLVIWAEGLLADAEVFLVYNCVRQELLPVDLAGSIFAILTAPTADLVVTLKLNGVTIGTVTFHTNLSYTVSFLAQHILNPGDQLTFHGQATADVTGAGISGTIVKNAL